MFGLHGLTVTTTDGNHSNHLNITQILYNLQYRYQEMDAMRTELATNVSPVLAVVQL